MVENALTIDQEDKGEIGFVYAFLDPPHSFMCGKTIFDKGKFFLDFCQTLFTDISQIEVYWSTLIAPITLMRAKSREGVSFGRYIIRVGIGI